MNKNAQQLLKGSLNAVILKLLSQTERMYGYEICQKVKEMTRGELRITEGALYPALHKLEGEGILITQTEVVDGRARKYYSIASDQKGNAVDRLATIQNFLSQLQLILEPKDLISIHAK
ncbi:PadR family transcriptional regulator [Dyadobacter subterraneus]|uniref:Helix-turn-helix transcriptional regulator n=1 Tax=Dyadobacter subterraneus TaxID=2773304 RepID=A0ABR9WDD1_9BACT|nr:PadR family transcriptional regulator [Dyadobacter subterraneus]MBE9463485.1 helix-turn-helix transcriptional regulator [Dyadobacter subterraneus]